MLALRGPSRERRPALPALLGVRVLRALRAAAALALLGGLTAACGRGSGSAPAGPLAGVVLTVSMSLAEEEQDAIRALLGRFEQETGGRVRLVAVSGGDLPQRLEVDVRAGRPTIDLFAQDNLTLHVLVAKGLVEDLSDVPPPEAVLPILAPPRFAGRQYFLPFRPNVQVTYVNRARFQQAGVAPPRTAEELREVARALKAAAGGIPKVTLALDQGAGAAVTLVEWIVAFGGDPLRLDGEGAARAFEFLQGLWAEALLARESLVAKFDTQVDFLQGETAWLAQNWPFTSMVFAEQDVLDRFDVYEGWRGPARAAHVIGGDVLGIPKGVPRRRKEGAVALARFLMSREAQAFLVERNAWPSIRGDAYRAVPSALTGTFAGIRAALADGFVRPAVPEWPAVTDALNEAVRRIIERGEPAGRVLTDLQRWIDDGRRAASPAG